MIKKVVIPAAGLGTRLLPATKEMPKEMLPIFSMNINGEIIVKPLLQAVFEQLYDVGVREFCFIVGRGKGSIVDHFSCDYQFLKSLKEKGKRDLSSNLYSFYEKVNSSSIVFLTQPEPRGFGDAVLKAEPYIDEPFLVHAGDSYILTDKNEHLMKILSIHNEYKSAATFLIQEISEPSSFGIIEGEEIDNGIYNVKRVVEKPKIPPSNLAITAIYLFNPIIFKALTLINQDIGGELQLTDGIQKLIELGKKVIAVKLDENEFWLDIGNPQSYWEALNSSYNLIRK